MFELMLNKLDGMDKRLNVIDERLDGIDKTLEIMDGRLVELEKNQNTILNFVSNADTEFAKIEEKTKDIDKLKKVININAIG